ncbi:hypothetical protein [Streptodolium elevatio]
MRQTAGCRRDFQDDQGRVVAVVREQRGVAVWPADVADEALGDVVDELRIDALVPPQAPAAARG